MNGPSETQRPRWILPFAAFALLLLIGSQVYGFVASPPDRDMGHLQKIMYVHVPAAWGMLVAYAAVFVLSLLYLWKRQEKHDLLAASVAEVGVVFNALALALGSIWGRPTWGVWWTWDARLTSTAVLLVIFAGYLALRAFTEDPDRRARWSAAVGILGFLNSYVVYMSVRWWRTLHQTQSTRGTVEPEYALGLELNAFGILFVMIVFIALRYRAAKLDRMAEARLEEAALGGKVMQHV
jgi:heme exporter protein C